MENILLFEGVNMVNNDKNDFDNYADNYREIHTQNIQKLSGKDSDYFSEYKIKEISDVLNNNAKLKILDVGCGDGNTARYFKKYFTNSEYIGIDISKSSIDIAKNKYKSEEKISFEQYNGKNIPYTENTFDIIFIACVLHHVVKKEHEDLLKECKRVLKKNGRIIIFEHNPYNPLTIKTVNTCPFDEDAVLMNSKYLNKLLKDVGFVDVNVRYTIFVPRVKILEKLVFIEKYLYWLPIGGQYYLIGKK